MVGTGLGKLVSGKTVTIIMGAITVGIAFLVLIYFTDIVFGEKIDIPKKGENARFMRYMACAIAMCEAANRQIDPATGNPIDDGCTSDAVEGWTVEYNEDGDAIKGCKEVCNEVKARMDCDEQAHYCQPECYIEYTFQEETEYNGNITVSGSYLDLWEQEVPCPGKSGFQTDASCSGGWAARNILDCGCMNCIASTKAKKTAYPEGRLSKHIGGCGIGNEIEAGTIWIPDTMVAQCAEEDIPYITNGLAWCKFAAGQKINIWAEDVFHSGYDCWMFDICLFTFADHYCPQVGICPSP